MVGNVVESYSNSDNDCANNDNNGDESGLTGVNNTSPYSWFHHHHSSSPSSMLSALLGSTFMPH
jgi:hypothetical protein